MRGLCVEQFGRWHPRSGRGDKRWWKRYTAKLMRRLGMQMLDDAPRRVPFRGWAD